MQLLDEAQHYQDDGFDPVEVLESLLQLEFQPSREEQVIWTDLSQAGDGFQVGFSCYDPAQQLSRFLTPLHCFGKLINENVYQDEDAEFGQPGQPLVLKVDVSTYSSKTGKEDSRLSRLDVLKQTFDAMVNRLIAYQFKAHVGLFSFDSNCRIHLPPGPSLENFRKACNGMAPEGNTKLWDGLALAKDQLLEYAKRYPDARKRIVVLSDGVDTDSASTSEDIA